MELPEKLYEVLKHEGVVSIVSWGNTEPHITNTWNSYIKIKEGNKLLIPAGGMHSTEDDVKVNNKVKLTLGSRNVEGFRSYKGTGFLIEGQAVFLTSGDNFSFMKELFPWASRILEITVTSIRQLL